MRSIQYSFASLSSSSSCLLILRRLPVRSILPSIFSYSTCFRSSSKARYNLTTSIYQPTNEHIISHKTILKHFKTLRHVSILSDHHQAALFLAKVILQYSQFNSYLQTGYCGSISCCVGMCCGAVTRCASYDAHLATAPQHNMICCHNTSFANTN